MENTFIFKLQDILDVSKRYIDGDLDEEKFQQLKYDLSIKTYIPIKVKSLLVMELMNEYLFNNNTIQEISEAKIEVISFFLILLATYASIDCNNKKLWTYENYDLLYPLFYDTIIQYCKNDYNTIRNMFRDTINAYNLEKFLATFSSLTSDGVEKAILNNNLTMDKLYQDRQLIDNLSKIATMNDPEMSDMVDKIKTSIIKKLHEDNNTNETSKDKVDIR